jgi:hypothetical protein
VGVTIRESNNATVKPPITAMARGCKSSEPEPSARAKGSIPNIAASEVISTGGCQSNETVISGVDTVSRLEAVLSRGVPFLQIVNRRMAVALI